MNKPHNLIFSLCLLVIVFISNINNALMGQSSDSTKYFAIKMAESVMARHPNVYGSWDYVTGTVLKSFQDLYAYTGEQKYYTYVFRTVNSVVDADGNIDGYKMSDYNIDEIREGSALLFLYNETGLERYKQAAEKIRTQLDDHPRTSEGGFWHKQKYPNQMWLDGLYMGSPFYAEYGKVFNQVEAFDDVANQILLMYNHIKDSTTGLYFHGWDESLEQDWADPESGLSECFWGRGMGWFAMAIVDVLDYLPNDHKDRAAIIQVLANFAKGISVYQDTETGLWWQVIDRAGEEGNYLEASASCMFTYALAKAVRLNYIDDSYFKVAKNGFEGILEHLLTEENDQLHLNSICRSAGLGYGRDGSYNYYINETEIVCNDGKGIGPFILAALEFDSVPPVIPSSIEFSSINYSIYPNPANDILIINFGQTNSSIIEITILDLTGKVQLTEVNNTNIDQLTISINNLPNGVYFVQVNSGNSSNTQKLIVTDN